MPDEPPDFDAMSDEEAKRLFMSLARDDDHRKYLQTIIDALQEEDPTVTEGEIIRNALKRMWDDTEPDTIIDQSQTFGSVSFSYIRNDYSHGNGKVQGFPLQHPNMNKPGSKSNDDSDDDPPTAEDATD